MPAFRLAPILAVVAALAPGVPTGLSAKTQPAAGQIPAAKPAPRNDLYGDPLPDGAVARFGSARFRHAGLSDFVLLADGRTVLTAGGDRMLRFWDVATGRPTRRVQLQGKSGPGSVVTLSPDGKTLVAHAQARDQLVFWDVESGKEIKALPGPKGGLGYLYFSPDGKTLAVGRTTRVSLWEWEMGREREVSLALNRPDDAVQMYSSSHGGFSPDGKWFVAGANNLQPLGVFEAATGREVRRHTCFALSSAVSPDSRRLAVCSCQNDKGGRETVIRLFDLVSGKEVAQFPFGTEDSFYSLAFSPDGKVLACAFSDRSCLLDLTTGKVLHRFSGRPLAPAFTSDGKTLVASTGQRLLRWDVDTGKERDERPGEFGYDPVLAASPDGRLLASGDWMEQVVSLWDTTDGRLLRQLPLKGEGRYVRNLAFSADGQTLVACQGMGFLQFWDVASGKEQRTVAIHDPSRKKDERGYFFNLHVSPDGKHVSALDQVFGEGGRATRLALWDIATGKPTGQHRFPGELRQVAWMAGGKAAVVPVNDGLAMIDVASGLVALRFSSAAGVGPLVTSPDGRLLAGRKASGADANGNSATIVVWETATGKEVVTVATSGFGHLALAPNNRCLVTTEYGVLHVRDLATGKVRHRWPLPEAETGSIGRTWIFALVLSPDGRRAFTVLADGTALVWDISSALRPAEPLVKEADTKKLDAWWAALSVEDAGKAQHAVWAMADAPKQAVPFLGKRLKAIAPPDEKQVRRWIADLESDDFQTRETAQRELSRLAELIEPLVQEALKGKTSIETRRRLEQLLQRSTNPLSPEELRQLRALQALELIGTPEVRAVLETLARGAPGARPTREAAESLARLNKRAVVLTRSNPP